MNIGDLVELSAYGKKILENKPYHKRLGMIRAIREYTKHTGPMHLSYAVSWFGNTRGSRHPRRDLKYYSKEVA